MVASRGSRLLGLVAASMASLAAAAGGMFGRRLAVGPGYAPRRRLHSAPTIRAWQPRQRDEWGMDAALPIARRLKYLHAYARTRYLQRQAGVR